VGLHNEPVKLLGARNESNQKDDVINDRLIHCTDGKNVWVSVGTTDPGIHAMITHPEGAAHMCLGPHYKIWVLADFRESVPSFTHVALCARPDRGCKPVKYYRDKNKNFIYDKGDDIQADPDAGIAMHRMSKIKDVEKIGLYSEGCQARLHEPDHTAMINSILKVPEVAASHFVGTNKKRFWKETEGKDYWSYIFSYLLTLDTEWNVKW
ncbi:MAG TPA: hypothetical protein PKK43_13345, partial [Spirochaetota bacterium]|nr:hypothetical protein [Spirochaetota bacterium]